MSTNTDEWTWADLSADKMEMLAEAEETLGADILLAYKPGQRSKNLANQLEHSRIRVADLNDSQIECLQGMEQKLQAVVVAYQQE